MGGCRALSCADARCGAVLLRPASRCTRRLRTARARTSAAPEQQADLSVDVVNQYQDALRLLPLWAGGLGLGGLIANRALSGVAAVVDASSSQSRADVAGIVMAAVMLLTGLQWLSLKPKTPVAVALDGVDVLWFDERAKLPADARAELEWAWTALQSGSRCRSLVLLFQGHNLFFAGRANASYQGGAAAAGSVCRAAIASQKGNYLANLVLYPGRLEFTSYLPEATQGVVVQPVGEQGVLVAGTDTLRGFSRLDQAWIATIADKLENTLSGYDVPLLSGGFGAQAAHTKRKARK